MRELVEGNCDDDVLCGNLWKERNWRVFDQKLKTPMEVMQEIKHEADTRKLLARGQSYHSSYLCLLFSEYENLTIYVISAL